MDIITINVDRSELDKLDNYEIIATDSVLRSFVTSGGVDMAELHDGEIDEIIDKCKEAIDLRILGVHVDIELGRSPQTDERTYTLMGVYLAGEDEEYCDLKVADMVVYMNNYFKKDKKKGTF